MMTIRNFIDRTLETQVLEDLYKKSGFRAVLIYGRRRIGKTYLIKKVIEGKKALYFLCLDRSIRENVNNFSRIASSVGLPYIKADTLIEFFERLAPYINGYIVVLDEFQYLIENDKGVLGDMQYVFDEILSAMNIMVIISGSSVGMLEEIGQSIRSPLYGRFVSRMKVKSMCLSDTIGFHPASGLEEVMRIYGAAGGVPLYHRYFQGQFFEDVRDTFFNPGHFLYNEAEFLLRQELRGIGRYSAILRSMAEGNTRITEIANSAYMDAKDLPKYISTLMSIGIVRKVSPITLPHKARNSIYEISDHYFRFWLTFVERFRGDIELGNTDRPMEYLKKGIDRYTGRIAEEAIRGLAGREYEMSGRWWKKGQEIDIVALSERKKEILFGEVKWRNRPAGWNVVEELMEKREFVQWHNEDRKERFLVVSKAGFTKKCMEKMEQEGVMHWDLRDVEKIVRRPSGIQQADRFPGKEEV